jgi:hypothetical protein
MKVAYAYHERKEAGAPYTRASITIEGRIVWQQLGKMTEAEIEDRVRSHFNPPPAHPFTVVDSGHPRRAGRPSKSAKPSSGWRDDDLQGDASS